MNTFVLFKQLENRQWQMSADDGMRSKTRVITHAERESFMKTVLRNSSTATVAEQRLGQASPHMLRIDGVNAAPGVWQD